MHFVRTLDPRFVRTERNCAFATRFSRERIARWLTVRVEEGVCPMSRTRKHLVRLALAAGVVVLVGVPTALAIHDFSDVPDGNPFHDDIAAIKRAGITTGKTCDPPGTPPTYCPGEPITREAMAAFVHRGFGRVAYGHGLETPLNAATYTDLAMLTIRAGGSPGGTGFIVLSASVTAIITSTTGCPCMAGFHIAGAGNTSDQRYVTLDSVTTGGTTIGFGLDTGSLTWVIPVSTAVDHLFTVKARIFGGTGSMEAYAALSAQYVPFGSMGTDVLGATTGPVKESFATVR